jgi:hypothetical protein
MALIKIEFDSALAPGKFLLCRALDPAAAGPLFDLLDDENTRSVKADAELLALARAFGWDEDEGLDAREYLKSCAVEERVVEDPGFFEEQDKGGTVEIYFRDLTAEKQHEVLAALGIKAAKDGNLDVAPLALLHLKEGS